MLENTLNLYSVNNETLLSMKTVTIYEHTDEVDLGFSSAVMIRLQ
jgi:hypothetical protein